MSPRRLFRLLSIVETVTWTLLIAGMLLKYVGRIGDWPVSVAGPIHGFAFLAYGAAALVLAVNQHWSARAMILAVVSAVVPYATIPLERSFERRGLLEGEWRREETGHPRDRRLSSILLRWGLRRPVLAAVLVLGAVAIVFAVLLLAGPPGGAAD